MVGIGTPQKSFRWLDYEVAPGTLDKGHVTLLQLADGEPLTAPVMVAHGAYTGPTVFIGGGIHGDELNGIRTAIASVNNLDLDELSGTVICMPVQNPVGYRNRRRLLQFSQNMEQDRKLNVHQSFPGSATGESAERIAYKILEEIIIDKGCDFVFDLHTGTSTFFCALHSFVPPQTYPSVAAAAEEAATALDLGLMVQATEGVYAAVDMPHMVCAERGIPVLGAELGAGGRDQPYVVKRAAAGIHRVLQQLNMLPSSSSTEAQEPQTKLTDVVWVRADHGGIFRPKLEIDPVTAAAPCVQKGQVMGEIIDLHGSVTEEVTAPVGGHVISLLGIPTVNEGEPIARIGVPG